MVIHCKYGSVLYTFLLKSFFWVFYLWICFPDVINSLRSGEKKSEVWGQQRDGTVCWPEPQGALGDGWLSLGKTVKPLPRGARCLMERTGHQEKVTFQEPTVDAKNLRSGCSSFLELLYQGMN